MGNESGSRLTARDGLARLTSQFTASGERNAFETIGTFSTDPYWLVVSAKDHRRLIIPLHESVGPVIEIGRVPRKEIVLSRGQTPQDPFPDLAGTFWPDMGGQHGSSGFEILQDGRFYWNSGGRDPASEYGFVKRVGDEIEFLPVRYPGYTNHFYMSFKFRTILWDGCLYLITIEPESIRDFCKAALTPERYL